MILTHNDQQLTSPWEFTPKTSYITYYLVCLINHASSHLCREWGILAKCKKMKNWTISNLKNSHFLIIAITPGPMAADSFFAFWFFVLNLDKRSCSFLIDRYKILTQGVNNKYAMPDKKSEQNIYYGLSSGLECHVVVILVGCFPKNL